jgi:hypothetical protein
VSTAASCEGGSIASLVPLLIDFTCWKKYTESLKLHAGWSRGKWLRAWGQRDVGQGWERGKWLRYCLVFDVNL